MANGSAVIIVGVNRGGTSAVAASLSAIGLFLGETWHKPIYEDVDLARAFREKDWKSFKLRVAQYEKDHAQFAWKLPDAAKNLPKVHALFQRPKYIFVFRDPLAISMRMSQAFGRDVMKGMTQAIAQQKKMINFISSGKAHYLLVSYEKMLTDTDAYACQVLDFLGIGNSAQKVAAIEAAIFPSPVDYKIWSDQAKKGVQLKESGYQGHLDHLGPSMVSGWAKSATNDEPVIIEVYVDGKPVSALQADEYGEDLIRAGKSAHGMHRFTYFFEEPLLSGVTVSVKPKDSSLDLIGSPRKIAL